MPVSKHPALIKGERSFACVTGVVPPMVHFQCNPEVSNHQDTVVWPVLLSHGVEHAVIHLTEFFPGQVLVLDLCFFTLAATAVWKVEPLSVWASMSRSSSSELSSSALHIPLLVKL